MTAQLDIPELRRTFRLSSVVGRSGVKLLRAGREWKACCPFHKEKTPSFTINDEKGFYHCFGCGAHGDVLDYVQQTQSLGLVEAAEYLGAGTYSAAIREPAERKEIEEEPERDTTAEAVAIWRAASPAIGTPAETYLRHRALTMQPPASIRFSMLRYGSRGDPLPCLVALITSVENKAVGIQRTYLQADGRGKASVPKAKLSLGRVRGAAIRLAPAAPELIVCEGLEDGLTLAQEMGRPVWVAAGASMMPSMCFPRNVASIVIGADRDESGEREARKAAESFALEGRRARLIRPLDGFKDFNAELQAAAAFGLVHENQSRTFEGQRV